jgi:hypothetical protein
MLGVCRFDVSPHNDQSIKQFIEEYRYNIYLTLYALSKLSNPPLRAIDNGIKPGGKWNIDIPHLTRCLLGRESIDYQATWSSLINSGFQPPSAKRTYTKVLEHDDWFHPIFNGLVSIVECVNYPVFGGFTVSTYSLLKDMNPQIQDEIKTYLSEGRISSRTLALDEFLMWIISQKNNPISGTIAQTLTNPMIIQAGQGAYDALCSLDSEIFSLNSRVSALHTFFKLYDWIDRKDGYKRLFINAMYLKKLGYCLRAGILDGLSHNKFWWIVNWTTDRDIARFVIRRDGTRQWVIDIGNQDFDSLEEARRMRIF